MQNLKNYNAISWSPELLAYLKEVEQVASNLGKVGQVDQFFENSLLLSMDDGWGMKEFISCVQEILARQYEVSTDELVIKHLEVPKDKKIEYWGERTSSIRMLSYRDSTSNEFGIAILDLRNWVSEMETPAFLDVVDQFVQASKKILLVFWIPYMNEKKMQKIGAYISKKTSFNMLSVPPISIEKQEEYMKSTLKEKGFVLKDDCDAYLNQWLLQKRADGGLGSQQALESMCNKLIYYKMQTSPEDCEDMISICPEDIMNMQDKKEKETDAFELLDDLVGMPQVKEKIKEIVAQIKFQKELSLQGKDIGKPSMHMLFLGNPGTGKTTVARIVGQIFKQEGLLRVGEFQETTGNNFVEGLLSSTVSKVRGACVAARGSLMFIDEAYGMSVGHSGGNNTDAVVPVFVAEMENYRDDMSIIFAGYEDEMLEFLKSNPGLKSRIPHVIHFPNYTRSELVEIFLKMIQESFDYEDGMKEVVEDYFDNILEYKFESKEFGNVRFVRNLYECVWGKAAYRIQFSEDKEVILKVEDFKAAVEEEAFASMVDEKSDRKIGFQMN